MMTHRTQVMRDSTAGYSDTHSWAVHGPVIICKLWASSGKEVVGEENVVAVEDLRMIVPVSTDIRILDAVYQVWDRSGSLIDDRMLQVQTILARSDHLELVLEALTT